LVNSKSIKNLITDFFQLDKTLVVWAVDEHYTTEADDLSDIFDDKF